MGQSPSISPRTVHRWKVCCRIARRWRSLREWKCDSSEDLALLKHRRRLARDATIGALYFTHGLHDKVTLRKSSLCLNAVFGNRFRISYVQSDELWTSALTCDPVQSSRNTTQRRCWVELMMRKLEAARLAPFDITIMIDSDMFANPLARHPTDRGSTLSALRSRFANSDVDILFGMESSFFFSAENTLGPRVDLAELEPSINGGLVIYRRSAATDRFFACTQQLMRQHIGGLVDDQWAYQRIVNTHGMNSIQAQLLPRQWSCKLGVHHTWASDDSRGVDRTYTEVGIDARPVKCIFVHSHALNMETVERQCSVQSPEADAADAQVAAAELRSRFGARAGSRGGRSRGGRGRGRESRERTNEFEMMTRPA